MHPKKYFWLFDGTKTQYYKLINKGQKYKGCPLHVSLISAVIKDCWFFFSTKVPQYMMYMYLNFSNEKAVFLYNFADFAKQ